MKRRYKKIYIQLYRDLVLIPMQTQQGSISIEYVESKLKEAYKDEDTSSRFHYIDRKMQKAFKKRNDQMRSSKDEK